MKRIATAALLAPAATWLVLWSPGAVCAAAVTIVALLCFQEFHRLAEAQHAGFPPLVGFAAGGLMLHLPWQDALLVATLGVMALMALVMRSGTPAEVLPRTAAAACGLLYCFVPWRCGLALRALDPRWLLFALALNWIGDTFAYAGGRLMGRHKLAPAISPGKTWEGTACSVAGSVLFGLLFARASDLGRGALEIMALSAATNVAGQIGDLCESALKRGAGVKDSGSILPGHGGWLDRLDSSLFALPLVYAWVAAGRTQ